ncbi:MAG: hypothetical protein ABSB78_12565 [Bacteroidota bacterium]
MPAQRIAQRAMIVQRLLDHPNSLLQMSRLTLDTSWDFPSI